MKPRIMPKLDILFLIAASLCITLITIECTDPNEETNLEGGRSDNATDKFFSINWDIENFTMWGVECNTRFHVPSATCNFVLYNGPSPENTANYTTCQFNLNSKSIDSYIAMEYIRSYRFGNRFLVSWIEYSRHVKFGVHHEPFKTMQAGMFLNFVIVPMPSCNPIEQFTTVGSEFKPDLMDYHTLMRNHIIYLNEDSLDVFYVYTSDFKWCQERFDFFGQQTLELEREEDFQVNDDANAVINYFEVSVEVLQNRERYKPIDLCQKKIPCNMTVMSEERQTRSTANGYVSFCTKNSPNTWLCYKKFYISTCHFKLKFDYEPLHFMIYNIPYELILTITSKKSPDGSLSILMTAFVLDLTEFGLKVRAYKSVEVIKLENIPSNIKAHVFQPEYEEICLAIMSTNPTELRDEIRCFTRNELNE